MENYIIFDIDGTLNKTECYVFEAYQMALKKYGRHDVTNEEIRNIIGCTPKEIVKILLPHLSEDMWEEWILEADNCEKQLLEEYAMAFEGAKEVLQKLKADGYKLAVCSNATMEHIEMVLKAIGLYDYFDVYQSVEAGLDTKAKTLQKLLQRVQTKTACMVGDRKFDKQAATYNEIYFIGCAYGYAPQEVKEADVVVKSPSEIYEAVCRLLPKQ